MNCFIASAFDHDDIDAIYDEVVCPVLAEMKIKPLRVDRIEHNDDIDKRIFQLIDQSQLCIADLTHARPSVYYEAGYAFGSGKPVIYLARNDHFRSLPSDPAGNLRVHFDLQMKNIIQWSAPNELLKKRLRSRLNHVISPIIRDHKAEQAKSIARSQFEALSQNEKLLKVIAKGQSLFISQSFKQDSQKEYGPLRHHPYHAHLTKKAKDGLIDVHLLAFQGINKGIIEGLSWLWFDLPLTYKQALSIQRIRSLCLIGSLRVSRHQALAALLPNWTPIEKGIFRLNKIKNFHEYEKGKDKRLELEHEIAIVFIDGIRYEDDFLKRLNNSLESLF